MQEQKKQKALSAAR